jgi:hypothetical protein
MFVVVQVVEKAVFGRVKVAARKVAVKDKRLHWVE